MSVYRRHRKLWLRYSVRGELKRVPTPYRVGQERLAEAMLDQVRALEESGERYSDPLTGIVTVERYARQWLVERQADGVDSWKNERAHLERHIVPALGAMKIGDVRPRHLVALFADIRRAADAPRPKTIRNIYGTLNGMFRDAMIADLVVTNPCVLRQRQLGAPDQRDPLKAVEDLYTHAEVERLISAPELAAHHRVFYALEALAGLRLGEVAGLRWMHYAPMEEPLGRLAVITSYDKGRTKSRRARYVPVHPTLAAILAEWRLAWPRVYGRTLTENDLIVAAVKLPGKGRRAPTGSMLSSSMVGKAFGRDLEGLGIRHRRGHDLRSTFISLAEADGADRDRIEDVTHTSRQSRRGAFEGYLRRAWPILCGEVAKLKIKRRAPSKVRTLGQSRSTPRSTAGA